MRAKPDLPLDAVGVGNAIVDVIANVSDDFLVEQGVVKGAMTLIDAERATSTMALPTPTASRGRSGFARTGASGPNNRPGDPSAQQCSRTVPTTPYPLLLDPAVPFAR